ncbi:NADP-dependent oxidoreductase domain-containing protein [Phaeosphaeriaceae sp. PMI808]|nr:NADP-dependent oxidoreductase domain-containing protein [Phaeosphaeriaceae sp. PMI808]
MGGSTPANQKTYKLNNGVTIPAVGFGTFANEGSKGETYKAVTQALKTGYRHLDCAWFYQNEEEVGEAVSDFLASTPNVKRQDLFICTKVWQHLHEPDEVKWSFENSLEKLKMDYIDLFLVHWPIAAESNDSRMPKIGADRKYVIKKDLTENPQPTWRAMEELNRSGKARAIGVSNWTIQGLKQLLSFAEIKPTVNQIEIHPFLPNTELVKFCQDNDVLPAAYSPLGSQNQVPSTGEQVRTNPKLNEIAQRSDHDLAQVLLAWGLQRGYVVLPKSSTPKRIDSNWLIPELSKEDFDAVEEVAKGRHTRFVNMKDTFGYNVWPEEVDGELKA